MSTTLRDTVVAKARTSARLIEAFCAENAEGIVTCARAVGAAIERGGRLYAFGNGGGACDAQHLAVELSHPVVEKRAPLAAMALSADTAVLTAIGNDRDFALVFAEQLRLFGKQGDVAAGFSTSGQSANVLRGMQAARGLGMLTIGFTGRDGGRLPEVCDHCFIVPSFSIHRIQETHQVLLHLLWDVIHLERGEADVL